MQLKKFLCGWHHSLKKHFFQEETNTYSNGIFYKQGNFSSQSIELLINFHL